MKESSFPKLFAETANRILNNNLRAERTNLLYQLILNKNLELSVNDIKIPKRGQSAFQVDICIFETIDDIKLPRVAIEFKTSITTHNMLVYSTKAGKHKSIYPYLRYGLLASDLDYIPGRFFTHNENIDFMIAAKKYKKKCELENFVSEIIMKQIGISQKLDEIHFGDKKFDYYQKSIDFRNFPER